MENTEKEWKGYTLDELRVMRLVNLAKIELAETQLKHLTEKYSDPKALVTTSPIVSKLMGALDFFDYGVLAFKITKSVLSIFRRKKKR